MKHFTTENKLARAAMTLLVAVLAPLAMNAQQTVTIGNLESTSRNIYTPYYSGYNYSFVEQIYHAGEIAVNGETVAGNITEVRFYHQPYSTPSLERTDNIVLYMKNVERGSFGSSADRVNVSAEDIVFEGPWTVPVEEGWVAITLASPFAYDGESNLLVAIDENSSDASPRFFQCTETNGSVLLFAGSSSNPDPYNLASYSGNIWVSGSRANMQLDIMPFGVPFCLKPALSTVSNINNSEATLTVGGGSGTYNVQYKEASAENWTVVESNTTKTTFKLTGLATLTAYDIRVQSVCDANATSDWRTASFTTTDVVEAVGSSWSDNFEGTSCGWKLINSNCTNAWAWGTATNNGGTHALYISNDGGTSNAYTFNSETKVYAAKLFYFTGGKYEFAYDWMANGEDRFDFLRVALVPASQTLTAGTDYTAITVSSLPTGWIALDGGGNLNQVTAWQNKTLTTNVVAGSYYMVFAWRNDTSRGNQSPAAIDNVSITKIACEYEVTDLAVRDITPTSATFSWTAGDATQWQVAYSTANNFEGATKAIFSNTNPSITNLKPNTHYYVRVRAYRSEEDFGAWSDVLQFYTDCVVFTEYPWSENFDSYTAGTGVLPNCWSRINTCNSSSYSSYPYLQNSSGYSGANSLRLHSYTYSSGGNLQYDPKPQYAILPAMENLAGKQITLQAKGYYSTCTFKIGLMTDPTDATTFTEMEEQTLTTSYEEYCYNIPADATANYVAIMIDAASQSRNTNGVYIDDITIDEPPSCMKPKTLTYSDVTAHTVTLNWTPGIEGQTAWDVQFATNADFSENVNLVENVGSHEDYMLTGLDPETTYYVRVRANCGNGDVSVWGNKTVSFTTRIACPAPTSLVATPSNHRAVLNWNASSESYVVSYRTAAYAEGIIEEFKELGVPSGWTRYSGLVDGVIDGSTTMSTTSSGWSTNSYALGQYNMKLNIYGSVCKHWLVTPTFNLSQNLSFDLALTYYNSADPIKDPTAQADDRFVVLIYADDAWHILREWNNSGSAYVFNTISTTGENVTIGLSDYYGKKVKIAFYGESTVDKNGDNDLHIDNVVCGIPHAAGEWQTITVDETTATIPDLTPETAYEAKVQGDCGEDGTSLETSIISFTTLVACSTPTNVTAGSITNKSAVISWESEASSFNVRYKANDGSGWNVIEDVNTPYTLMALSPETGYEAQVKAICGGEDGESEWSASVFFTTLSNNAIPYELSSADITDASATLSWTGAQDSYNVRYRKIFVEGFEDETEFANWTFISKNTENDIASGKAGRITDARYNGYYGFRFSSFTSASDYNQYLISPELQAAGEIKFYCKKYNSNDEKLYVGYSKTTDDLDAFTWSDELSLTTSWQEYSQELPAGVKYIAFHYFGDYHYYVYVDDIHICPNEIVRQNGVTSPLQIANLEPDSYYEWQVQGITGNTETDWSERSYFTTKPVPVDITLANNATDNTTTKIEGNDGLFANVTLDGRTLYTDGGWNPLCLPFPLTTAQIAASPLAGADIRALSSASSKEGVLKLNFTGAESIDAGTPYIVRWNVPDLVINTTTDWDNFASAVNNGNTFAGKTVKLGADISGVTTMVGTWDDTHKVADHLFSGTFDGDGHTMTVNIGDGSTELVAPFRAIGGATIKNLKVEGTVNGGIHCGGLVAVAENVTTNSITNCEVAVHVTTTGSHCGGVLGHGRTSITTISNCLFSGSISGAFTAIGIFYGWGDNGMHTVKNCLFTGSATGGSNVSIDLLKRNGSQGTVNVTNCYKTVNVGTQGTLTTATGSALSEKLGEGWEFNGKDVVPKKLTAANIVNPVFTYVTVSSSAPESVGSQDGAVSFTGTYDAKTFTEADKNSVILLKDGNTLHYAAAGDALGACRSFITVDPDKLGTRLTTYRMNFGNSETLTGSFVTIGDVNNDGKVTPADAIMILYHYFGVSQTGFIKAAADVNGDTNISPADAIEALYIYFGASAGARSTKPANSRDPE